MENIFLVDLTEVRQTFEIETITCKRVSLGVR